MTYSIQAADCEGTKLTLSGDVTGIAHQGTVTARLLELKTGLTAGGQRNRILTFAVTGPLGTLTYTRAAGRVIDDVTGLPVAEVKPATSRNCELCGDYAGRGSRNARNEDGTTTLLCRDCVELDVAC